MPTISEAEKQQRRFAVGSVIGTHDMEGIELDQTVHALMERYANGELSLDQFSAAMEGHAQSAATEKVELAGAA